MKQSFCCSFINASKDFLHQAIVVEISTFSSGFIGDGIAYKQDSGWTMADASASDMSTATGA